MEIEFKDYKISWNSIDSGIPVSLQEYLEKIYDELQNPKSKTIDKILRIIKKFPNSPQPRNYLASLYKKLGYDDEANEINAKLLKKHPDYLFARIAKADQYIEEGKTDRVRDVVNTDFDLKKMYPERNVFHISEFSGINVLAVKYFVAINQWEQAGKRLEIMKEVEPDSEHYYQALRIFSDNKWLKEHVQKEKESSGRITPEHSFRAVQNENLAKIKLEETSELYLWGSDISPDFVNQYLSLDCHSLIQDLEYLIKESYLNFPDGDESFVAVHALFMLGELEAEESLDTILMMMQQNEDYCALTFGDICTEWAWIPLFKTGKNRLKDFENYLKLPGLYTYFRTTVLDAMVQISIHYPEQKEQVFQIFERLLNFFVKAKIEDNVIDTEFNGLLVWDLIDLKLDRFLPQIKMLYDKGYVEESVCGSYETVETNIRKTEVSGYGKRRLLTITEFYQELYIEPDDDSDDSNLDDDFDDSDLDDDFNYNFSKEAGFERTHKKIGRNEPCPCGSGKKFKKCCLGKGIYD